MAAICAGVPSATIFAAIGSALRAKVEDPVGAANHIQIVLDDEDGIAQIGEPVQDLHQFAYIVKVKTGGGLVEQVESASGLALGKLPRQFHALGFAAGERGGGLAEMHVAETDVVERGQFLAYQRDIFQNGQRVRDRQVENIGDGVALETNRQGFLIVTATVTYLTGDVDIGKKIHFNAPLAVALAGFAAAA